MFRAWGALFGSMLALAACTEEGELALEDPPLVITIDAPEIIEVPLGASLELTVHVRRADGTPATRYELEPFTSCECVASLSSTGTGTERVILSSSPNGYGTAFQVSGKVPDSSYGSMSEPHWVIALRDDATAIEAPVTRATLAVGERRPFIALATNRGRATGAPTSFSLSNALATVDAAGVVTAVAAGQVVLTATAGGRSTDIALTIDPALVVGPPPQGLQRLNIPLVGNTTLTLGRAAKLLDHALVIDGRGFPHALVSLSSRAALLSWTGTGFGLELLPDAYTPSGQAFLSIDDRDQLYVVGTSSFGAAVFDKPAAAPPTDWRKRALSQHVAALDRSGAEFTRYVQGVQTVSLLPRPGGGMDLVYAFRVGPVAYAYPCGIIYRHARVTDDAVALSDVTEDWGGPVVNSQCPSVRSFDAQSMVLVRGPVGRNELLLPYANRLPPLPYFKGTGRYLQASSTWWVVAREPELNKPGTFPVALPPVSINAVAVADAGTLVFEGLASTTKAAPYQFSSRGRLWMGDTTPGLLRLLDPYGLVGPDSPFPSLTASATPFEEQAQSVVWGAAADARAMFMLASVPGRSSDELAFLSRRVPQPDVSTQSPEARGRFFESQFRADGGVLSTVRAGPVRLEGGTRAVLSFGGPTVTSQAFARVLRSSAVDAPWAPGAAVTFSQETSLVARGGALYAMAYGEQLLCSVDQGGSWTPVSESAVNGTGVTTQLINAPGGLAGDLRQTVALWANPGTMDAGLVRWSIPLFFNGHSPLPEPASRSLFPADGGVYFVAGLSDSSRELYVARVAWDGGLVTEFSANTTTQYVQYLPRQGAAVSATEIVFPSYVPASGPLRILTNRVNLDTGAWEVGDAGQFSRLPPTIAALGDGGLVLGGTMASRALTPDGGLFNQDRAVLLFSADGLVWSEPLVIREEGGDLQQVESLADDGQGGVLVLLRDSLLMNQVQAHQVFQRVVRP